MKNPVLLKNQLLNFHPDIYIFLPGSFAVFDNDLAPQNSTAVKMFATFPFFSSIPCCHDYTLAPAKVVPDRNEIWGCSKKGN